MLRARSQAAAIRRVFPQVRQLRIELTFSDSRAHTPSPQVHTLYPAAPAFFRFACPCADCDGYFDLTAALDAQLGGLANVRARAQGSMRCEGKRSYGSAGSECSVLLQYRITVSVASAA